jgi:hypothetical protein
VPALNPPRALNTDHSQEDASVVDDRSRHWYDLRPEPRCRADWMGYNYTWWTVAGLIIIVIIAIFHW